MNSIYANLYLSTSATQVSITNNETINYSKVEIVGFHLTTNHATRETYLLSMNNLFTYRFINTKTNENSVPIFKGTYLLTNPILVSSHSQLQNYYDYNIKNGETGTATSDTVAIDLILKITY